MAVKFSQFDGTVSPSKTSTTQYIVGFEGSTNIKWTMKDIADEIGGSVGDTIFTTSPASTVPTGQVIKLTDSIKFESVSGAAYGGWIFKTAKTGAGANDYATISYGARTFLSHYRANEGWAFGGTNTTNSFHFNTGTTTMSDGWSMRVHGGANANGALIVKGAGLTSSTTALAVQDSDGADIFNVTDDGNFMLGKSAVSSTPNNVVIGGGATDTAASNSFNVIIGKDASITGTSNQGCIIIGDSSLGTANGSVAVGSQAKAQAANAIAIGQRAQPTGANSITLDASGSGLTTPSTANTFGVYMTSNTTPDFRVIGAEGMVPPSITTTVRDAISSPVTGSTIYNTTDNKLQFYNGSAWENASGGSSLWVEDANNPGNLSPSGGDAVDIGIGRLPINGQGLTIKAAGTAAAKSLGLQDSGGNYRFYVKDNGETAFGGGAGYGYSEIKPYSPTQKAGHTFGTTTQSFLVGSYGLAVGQITGTDGIDLSPSRFTIGKKPDNGQAQFNLFTTASGTDDAVIWTNLGNTQIFKMKENGRTSFSGQVSVGVGSGSNATIDFDTGNIQEITIPTETATNFTPTNAVAGSTYIIKITQAGTSGTMNWESSATVNWPGGTAPTLTATSAGVDIVTLVCTAGGATGGTFYGTSALNFS